MAVYQGPMTLEQFLELPEDKPALEFEEGRITQKVSPKARHSALQSKLVELINVFARSRRLALAFTELRCTFGGRSYVPDLSVLRWDRIPKDETGQLTDDVFYPPDIAIEVVSPKQGVNRLIRRCTWFADNGVSIAVLIDPDDASVILFRPGEPLRALHGEDLIDLSEVLPGFELSVAKLFEALKVE